MSDASLPNTTLRQRFDAFIAANTHKKASETDFRRKGSLGVGLIITDTLMSKPPSFPLNPDDFLADAGTQVKNLSGTRRAGLGIVGDGRDDGFDDVSAAVLAVRLEGMIRRWLARP